MSIQKETIITSSEKETADYGEKIGKNCQGGEVFLLFGDLGAGKTSLLQGLAKGLGVKNQINSPTFNILKLYEIKAKQRQGLFCHIDAYRLESGDDLVKLGIDEFLDDKDTVTAIEWAEKVKSIWPREYISIKISSMSKNKREIEIN